MTNPTGSQEASDVFSFSDDVLADRLEFVEEIGFGNWGSVWHCRPRIRTSLEEQELQPKIAVKLVHRSKTNTSAARVKSLWNEMKIIRHLRHDPHPSIISFHSFIITPSYALITMTYHPTIIPVEVAEPQAKTWFKCLLSALQHLHSRGIVHNDIKPANVLVSEHGIPVLVDFGFSEKYDPKSVRFLSSLSYGTPEYLSPERARGLMHDARKADVWALGVTFFEILVGRTPFEHRDGEQFRDKADLEKYWSRTLKAKWVGTWKISKGVEKLLRHMITPNADLRYTVSQALSDPYWLPADALSPRKISAGALFLPDTDVRSPSSSRTRQENKENYVSRPSRLGHYPATMQSSQKLKAHGTRTGILSLSGALSPIVRSPSATLRTPSKANVVSLDTVRSKHAPRPKEVLADTCAMTPSRTWKSKVLTDITGLIKNVDSQDGAAKKQKRKTDEEMKEKDRVKERVKSWERERERLKEMERLEAYEQEREDELEKALCDDWSLLSKSESPPCDSYNGCSSDSETSRVHPDSHPSLGQSVINTVGKTLRLYQPSSIVSKVRPLGHSRSESVGRLESDGSSRQPKKPNPCPEHVKAAGAPVTSYPPVPRGLVRDMESNADSTVDRMTLWMRNVEKCVDDACQNFASSTIQHTPSTSFAPLPHAPISRPPSQARTTRPNRMPRKVLSASQIFANDADDTTTAMANSNHHDDPTLSAPDWSDGTTLNPKTARRATVSVLSPERFIDPENLSLHPGSTKSKSQGDLFQTQIAPIAALELELAREAARPPMARLSATPGCKSFNAPTPTQTHVESTMYTTIPAQDEGCATHQPPVSAVGSSSRRLAERNFDTLLMSTSGVRRHGRGYQSDNLGPVYNTVDHNIARPSRIPRPSQPIGRAMPPSIAGRGKRRTLSVVEFGAMTSGAAEDTDTTIRSDRDSNTGTFVRRALKAIAGKTGTMRRSKML